MDNKKDRIYFFDNCKVVKGAVQSVICDPERDVILVIPNSLADFCQHLNGIYKVDLIKKFGKENQEIIEEYLDFLLQNEFIFYSEFAPECFPKIDTEFVHPLQITNVIWDEVFNLSLDFLKSTLNKNQKYLTGFLEIRTFKKVTLDKIAEYLEIFKNESIFFGISIIAPFYEKQEDEIFPNFFTRFPSLGNITFFNAKKTRKIIINESEKKQVVYLDKNTQSNLCCGIVNQNLFANTSLHIRESFHYNSCLNRKISIDAEGNIRNCPSMQESFGNIKDTSLAEAIEKPNFKKFWSINKDKIHVCKDCEFRHVCTDCRAYIENPGDIFSKPLKCGYNPYTSEWTEWSTNPLKQKVIDFYDMRKILD